MKDLDSIKLKSDENDDLKDKDNSHYIRKDIFLKNKVFNNIIKFGKEQSINIFLLLIAILINIYEYIIIYIL